MDESSQGKSPIVFSQINPGKEDEVVFDIIDSQTSADEPPNYVKKKRRDKRFSDGGSDGDLGNGSELSSLSGRDFRLETATGSQLEKRPSLTDLFKKKEKMPSISPAIEADVERQEKEAENRAGKDGFWKAKRFWGADNTSRKNKRLSDVTQDSLQMPIIAESLEPNTDLSADPYHEGKSSDPGYELHEEMKKNSRKSSWRVYKGELEFYFLDPDHDGLMNLKPGYFREMTGHGSNDSSSHLQVIEPDPKTPGLQGEPFKDPEPVVREAYKTGLYSTGEGTSKAVDESEDDPDYLRNTMNEEDRRAKDDVQSFFVFTIFLITVCVIVFSMTSRSAYYLTDAMTVSLMDTPFIPRTPPVPKEAGTTATPTPAPSKSKGQDLNNDSSRRFLGTATGKEDVNPTEPVQGSNNFSVVVENNSGPHMRKRRQVIESAPRRMNQKARAAEGGIAGGSKSAGISQTLRTSNTLEDFWEFMNTTFITVLYSEFLYAPKDAKQHTENDDRVPFYSSVLLGVPRIRQLRVTPDSCTIHSQVENMFQNCYGYFDASTEERREIPQLTPEVSETRAAWTYTQPEKLETVPHYGTFSTYGPGGFILDLSSNKTITEIRINELKENLWIGRATRAVIIDFTIYNSNVNLFVVCKLVIEFPPTGGLRPEGYFNTLKFLRYVSTQDMVVLGFEQVMVLFVACQTIIMFRLLIKGGFAFFRSFWNVLDLVILLLSYAAIIMEFYRFFVIEAQVAVLMRMKEEHPQFDFPSQFQSNFDHLCAVLVFLVWVRFIKFLSFNQTINELMRTIARSARGLISFSVVFIIIFLAFAQLGYLIFGSEVEEYRTVWLSALALLQAVLGKFNYKQLEESNFVLAPIFLILFVFFMFFVLMNVFGAIIFESYKVVRSEIYDPRENKAGAYLSRAMANIFSCGKRREKQDEGVEAVATGKKIRDALVRAGYTSTEIEIFFAKYEIKVDRDITGHEARKLKARLELRRFDFEPIDTSPETVAELLEEVKKLKRKLQQQTEETSSLKRNLKDLSRQIGSFSREP